MIKSIVFYLLYKRVIFINVDNKLFSCIEWESNLICLHMPEFMIQNGKATPLKKKNLNVIVCDKH